MMNGNTIELTADELDAWMDGEGEMPEKLSEAFDDLITDARDQGEASVLIKVKR